MTGVALPSETCDDSRVLDAWRLWLEALGTDAEAALAASLAYGQLDDLGRERWLDALAHDQVQLRVPRIAVYAPLLAVEGDLERRARIQHEMGPADAAATPRTAIGALRGIDRDGLRVAAITTPLYLNFVEVLACGYRVEGGIEWVRHDPIVDCGSTPRAGHDLEGAKLEGVSVKALIDELAHAVVAHTRNGRDLPDSLRTFAHLFTASTGTSYEGSP